MEEDNFLKNLVKVHSLNELQPDYLAGTLVLTDSQAVIDECNKRTIPVVGLEDEQGIALKCDQIIWDIDQVDPEDLERIYRRCKGIPWTIAYTNRCLIREFSMDDLDDLFALYKMPHMTDFMEPLFEYDREREYQENYINYIYKLYGFGMWLIYERSEGKLMGRAGIEIRESCDRDNQAELGFAIASDRWRQGYAFEVCSKIIDLAHSSFQLTSLIARCDPGNLASRNLLGKLGFEHVGYQDDGDMRFFREI